MVGASLQSPEQTAKSVALLMLCPLVRRLGAVLAFQPRCFHASEEPTAVRQKLYVDPVPWHPPCIVLFLRARFVSRMTGAALFVEIWFGVSAKANTCFLQCMIFQISSSQTWSDEFWKTMIEYCLS